MTPDRWQQVKLLFQRSLDVPEEERAAWIESNSGGDTELQSEVQSLLAYHTSAGRFLESPALAPEHLAVESPAPGDLLGVYRVVQRLGEGGMSVVYQAIRDDDEFRRLVAIKVLKRGMDTDFLVRRFRKERQILAHLDHPNIAKIFDGGSTPDGRPYFVMEFIAGKTIDKYCDEHKLNVRQRLDQFLRVCNAVEYAHQNLVVHRDLKPSNILMGEDGHPKLLDFGIAKLLEDDRDITASYLRLMTPEYASPEQITGERISTRSDIYTLGVILFELLTGQKPYQLRGRSMEEARQAVARTNVPRPSTAVARADQHIADLRGTRRDRLKRMLEDDLDNIVGKAMKKDPAERYSSVGQMGADIRRHFLGEPIIARKDSWSYRTRKFVQRHYMGVISTAAVILALTVGIVIAVYNARVANQQRAIAERRFMLVRNLANSMVNEVHDAIQPLPGSTSARELIVRRAQEYLDNLSAESGDVSLDRERAQAYTRIGDVLGNPNQSNLGDVKNALVNYRRALQLNRTMAASHPKDPQFLSALAASHERICAIENRMGDFNDAMDSCGEAVKIQEAVVDAAPKDLNSRGDLGYAYEQIALPYSSLGEWNRSRDFQEKALAAFEDLAKSQPQSDKWKFEIAQCHNLLATLEENAKRFPLARTHATKAVAGFQALAAAHPDDNSAQLQPTFALQRLGSVLLALGDLNGARSAFEQALPARARSAGLDPNDARARLNLLRSHNSIGYTLVKLGDPEGALEHFQIEEKLARDLVTKDPSPVDHHTSLANAYEDIGSVWMYYAEHAASDGSARGFWVKARPYFLRALEIVNGLQSRGAVPANYSIVYDRLKAEVAACDKAVGHRR